MSQSAATEFGPEGIRVNVICAGATMTPALEKWSKEYPEAYERYLEGIPMKRLVKPRTKPRQPSGFARRKLATSPAWRCRSPAEARSSARYARRATSI